ncbi:unnamed protein product [Phytophthora lilii]|uniref:Unnamed protein product n=1 Tax=Phytophthora lilii TaxID=2077276 RepID=A0A9W6TGX8_9STRA|nr:unnamed protein product [Phytophthora lilii]
MEEHTDLLDKVHRLHPYATRKCSSEGSARGSQESRKCKQETSECDGKFSGRASTFDHVMKHYPETEAQLATTSSLVKFPEFENGIVKVLASKEQSLTRAERTAVSKLLKSGTSPSEEVRQETPIPKKRSFAEAALAEENATAPQNQVDLRWIPPTSNDVERLFSRAGVVYSRIRRSLNPMTLETVMFLQYNRSLWDSSCVAQAVENNRKKRRAEQD